ncbi:MAG: NADH-quinone oxidoreductase subunit NuoH [Thermoleophilaceae bacterium]|nr:NADH-quinone oxidoreductase subunit NuoH [Thermoleophilaceae bacterium]
MNFAEGAGVQILKSLIIFAVVLQIVPIILMADRKVMGRMQSRYGPNRVGPYGSMQPIADVLKLLSKEQFTPRSAVPWMMALAPMISITAAVATIAIIPFGDRGMWGGDVGLYGIDVSIGILYAFAFGALSFYGPLLGGWSSGSKYSFLGSMRAAAQLISFEVAMGLSLLGVIMSAGTLSLVGIVDQQAGMWFVVPQIVGFIVFVVAGFAETNRVPFDLPEAESELVQGYLTEYGGMRFGTYFMAEYVNIITISALVTTLFLGGWHGPGPDALGPLWVILKMFAVLFLFVWVRATMPRLRYDQLMSLGWKVLLPLATLNALVTAILVVVT